MNKQEREIIARKLLIEQTRKEVLDELKQYTVGAAINGEITVKKDSADWNGLILVIPKEKYAELFTEEG